MGQVTFRMAFYIEALQTNRAGETLIGQQFNQPVGIKTSLPQRLDQAIPIHWGTFRLSNEAYDTPPQMLGIYARCAGLNTDAFRPRRIGEELDVIAAPLPTVTPDAKVLADCKPGSAALNALK